MFRCCYRLGRFFNSRNDSTKGMTTKCRQYFHLPGRPFHTFGRRRKYRPVTQGECIDGKFRSKELQIRLPRRFLFFRRHNDQGRLSCRHNSTGGKRRFDRSADAVYAVTSGLYKQISAGLNIGIIVHALKKSIHVTRPHRKRGFRKKSLKPFY